MEAERSALIAVVPFVDAGGVTWLSAELKHKQNKGTIEIKLTRILHHAKRLYRDYNSLSPERTAKCQQICTGEIGGPHSSLPRGQLTGMRQLMAEFVSAEHDEVRAMFYRGLRLLEHAFRARKEYMTKEGEIIYGGPDHYARLAATKHFRTFLAAASTSAETAGEARSQVHDAAEPIESIRRRHPKIQTQTGDTIVPAY